MRPLIIDSFAGGGGASEGIRAALGRDPDIAINHDRFALAMHRINHPGTRHLEQDVATVDAVGMCGGRPVGLLWMSPDCTDHSKAKGSAPLRENGRTTRGIGWAIVGWVKALPPWQRPEQVYLENVEEYIDWGPLLPDGRRCPDRKGETFKRFVEAWRALGYRSIEWRTRRAWWSGSGTIRRRLFMVMRRDGRPVVWPAPTFGNPNDPADAARIASGELQRWVTAADCIDFTLPIPSIFESSDQIKHRFGFRAKRPLATKTQARLAKGVARYVLGTAKPFIVKVNHTGRDEQRDRDLGVPLTAVTGKRDDAIVIPYLVPRYGERPGQEPRTSAADVPLPTLVPTGNEGGLAAIHVMRQFGASIGSESGEPVGTITAGGAGKTGIVAAFLAQHTAGSHPGAPAHSALHPVSTITVKGCQQSVVAAHMLTLRGSDRRDASAEEPARTFSAAGNHAAVVSLPLMNVYYGADDDGAPVDAPSRTETAKPRFGLTQAEATAPPLSSAQEARAREVAAFLRAHGCWDGGELVTLDIEGVTYVVVDICMRMLTPRERYNANGFRRDYIIDRGLDEDGTEIRFTLEQQGFMCGNAVCPTESEALIAANYRKDEVEARPRRPARREALPLFAAE